MAEPIRLEMLGDQETKAGNYFVSNYPPFSFWSEDQKIEVEKALDSQPTPGAKPTRESSDEISIWMYDGMAIIEVEANKFVPKQKNWVFSAPQIATVETLALVAIQRYHHYALKAV